MPRPLLSALALAFMAAAASAAPEAKRVPPEGIEVPAADQAELSAATAALGAEIDSLQRDLANKPALLALLPDVQIFHNAARCALGYGEFFDPKDFAKAKGLLALGQTRAAELRAGSPSWTKATGPVLRGYRSKIDGSVQPYALLVPADWKPEDSTPRRLDFWAHGRNEKLTELAFLFEHLKGKPEFAPGGTFVLQLYGRFCNANKFAGEVDLFEAWDSVARNYPIDPDRVCELGFSMGGAAAWHFAAHHAGLWAAASPGAGFAETAVFNKAFAEGKEPPPWWEQVLWRWYDATAYAANLANCPAIAYSGEIDPQKQAADIMEQSMAAEGLPLERLIGPQTAHKYHPETKQELARRIDALAAKGRDAFPAKVRFTTYTLRYHRMKWIELDALERHWERADLNAERLPNAFTITTRNIAAFRIVLPADLPAPDPGPQPKVTIDGQALAVPRPAGPWQPRFVKEDGRWRVAAETAPAGLRKTPGLTGPIDDAFMDSFVFVRPTGQPLNAMVGKWAADELVHATLQWRRVFRGEARILADNEITDAEIASSNLVLWGDPSSNRLLQKILPKLPLAWNERELRLGTESADPQSHAPVMIFPNPLNPKRYIVLNSGFTFREVTNNSNAMQTPKLPDWALVDLTTPPDSQWPGRIANAGFFDEHWAFTADRPSTPPKPPAP